jgi:hypothetical protein
MPKKTKKEKILAEQRRHSPLPSISQNAFAFRVAQKDTIQPQPNTEELTVIRHDLIRTIILALVAVGIELGIYTKMNGKW